MAKPVKRVDLSKLTPEQRQAVTQLYKDMRAFGPTMGEIKDTAQAMFLHLLKQPEWRIAESEPPGGKPQQSLWHVGAPQVNYVDHIDPIEKASDK